MNARITAIALSALIATAAADMSAQSYTHISSTQGNEWSSTKGKMDKKAVTAPVLEVARDAKGHEFKAWGITFNELDWDALSMLTREEQDEILHRVFAPDGDLRVTRGRISPGANDYARSWYSCDEVEGDFNLNHFNIDRDKQAIIPFIRAAQKYNPDITCWISPWCPPSWMKINGDYPVVSSKYNNLSEKQNYLLFGTESAEIDEDEMKLTGARDGVFPRQLATTDYMIQDPRYLRAYANYFCRFIDAYKEQGIPIDMVMYQNEAYSYTPYPGCAWTAEGTIRFNRDYLAPALKRNHPEVKLYLGTFNTNRYDHVSGLLADQRMPDNVSGIGFQWEGGQILPRIRKENPGYRYISTESECGNGDMDWNAAEHTFHLINHYIGNGCSEYNNWNLILCDKGESAWGWRQNARIRVNSADRTFEYTPEYYAYRHYSSFIQDGADILAFQPKDKDKTPVMVASTKDGKYVVVAGNFNDEPRSMSVKVGNKYLDVTLPPHSLHTFAEK